MRREDAVLFACGQPAVKRKHLRVRQLEATQCLGRVPDLPFARAEDQDVAGPNGDELTDRVDDGVCLVAGFGAVLPY